MSSRSKSNKNADIEVDRGAGAPSAVPRRVRETTTYRNPTGRIGGSAVYHEPSTPSSSASGTPAPPELMEGIETTPGDSNDIHDIPMPDAHEVPIHESSTVRLILHSFIHHSSIVLPVPYDGMDSS